MSGEKPCKWPLKKRLRKHSPFVIDEVIVDNYVTDLHAAEKFSNRDRDRITALKGISQKEEFVNTLMHKDEPVIRMFLDLTRKSDRQPQIYAVVMSKDEGAEPVHEEGSDGASDDSKEAEPVDATSSAPEFHDTCDRELDSSRREPSHVQVGSRDKNSPKHEGLSLQESEKQMKPGYPGPLMGRKRKRISNGSQKRKLVCAPGNGLQEDTTHFPPEPQDTSDHECGSSGNEPGQVYSQKRKGPPLHKPATPKCMKVDICQDKAGSVDEHGDETIHLACQRGHTCRVIDLLIDGSSPNEVDEHGQTPLQITANGVKDIPELCRVLLEHDASIINALDEDGNQPLHLACKQDNRETVKVMLSYGANPNAMNKHKQTPLHTASQGGCPELCQLLIEKGAKVNAMDGNGDTALQVTLQKGNLKTAELLLDNGADYKVLNGAGETVLHLLCKGGVDRHELCEDLISRGVSPRQTDRENNLPMHLALKNKLHKTFYLLFKQCGVSTVDDLPKMNIQNNDISDLLCFSVSCCDAELCQKLLTLGANPNAPNTSDLLPSLDFLPYDAASMHPLHIAVAKNNSELCHLLLDHRANVNVQMHMHYSTSRLHLAQPLHLAAQKGFIGVCRLLIEQDAFINAQTNTGISPLHLAIVGNKEDIVRLLLCHGAILGNVMIGGVSALEWSATRGSRSLASLLHDSEAFPDEIVSQIESSLQIYMSSCSEETAVTVFLHVDVVGHDGAGRTSLTKALTLQEFDPRELITRKVVFDPDPKCKKGSCDWTTPVTGEHYRDMYDKNIAAIMAGKLDTPEVKDQYFRSKEEERLKRKTQGVKETGQKSSVILSQASKCARKTAATTANAEPSAAVQQYDQQAVQSPQDGRKRQAWAALPLCDVPDTTLSQSMETSQSIETMTEIGVPEKIKKQVSEFLENREFLDKAQREMMVTFSDYAGQPVLYNTLHLRMSKAGFYYVVFDASQPLEGEIPRKQEIVHVPLVDDTNFDQLLEWMSTIYVMEADHSHHIMLFGEVRKALPVMFLVGTHADKLREQPGLLERQDGSMRKKLEGTVLAEHIIWASKDKMCFYVDNTLTDLQSGTVDDQVVLLRQKTKQVAHQVAQHHKVPVTWLKFEQEVRDVKVLDKAKKTMPVEDLLHLAKTVTGIQTKEELDELLHYLSNRAVLFYHPKALENGKEEVVLDVGWLISQLEKLITGVPPGLENDVKRSREKGIMTAALINHLLSDSRSGQQFLMSLMKDCDLLCQYKQLDDNCFDKADDLQDYVSLKRRTPTASPESKEDVECSSYFVPCVIQKGITLKSADVEDACSTVPLILMSDNVCIPKPFFYRLLSRCATRFPRLPQMFANAGYFCVYPDHKLQISLERYFLQMIVFTTNKEHLVPAVCFLVREYITAEVDKAKHPGMSGLELKLGFYYVTRDSAVGRQQDFVSLKDYPAIDMDIDLPSGVKVWYPDSGEIKPQMCMALDAVVTGNTSSQSLPLCTLMSSPLTSYLHVGSQPHECLLKVAGMMDEEDNIGDDWRKLWSELVKQPLSEDAKRQTEGPTIYTLEMWAEGCHPSEATVGRLIRVLSAVYRNDAAEILLEYAKKSPIHPARTEDVLDILGPKGKEHFFEAIKEGKMNIARVNLDLVGDGEAGKSSLCDSLMDEPFIEKRESTKGASVLYMVRTATGSAINWKKDEKRSESLGRLLVGGSVMADSRAKSLQAQPLLDSESSKGDISANQDLQTTFLEESSQISAAEGDKENISMPPVTVEDLESNSPMSVREESSQVSSAEGGNKDTSTPSVTGKDMESSSSLRKESSQASGKDNQDLDFEKEFQTAKDLTVERAKEIKSLQDDPGEIQKRNELIYISVCDRGGQQHYLPIHTALIANCSEFIPKAYLLVFDLTKRLDGVATATYRAERGGEKVPITSYPQMKNKAIIGQWASAVDLAHPQSEMLSDNLQQKVRPYLGHPKLKRGPPMFIIGTHYDKIEGKKEEFVDKQEVAIRGILKKHKYTERVVTVKDKDKNKNKIIFKVDNTRSGTGTPDDMVNSLKEQIVEMAMAYRKAMKATPLPYVVLELGLLNVSQPEGPDSAPDSDRKILNMEDVVPLAKKYCNIKDEERCETALKYLSSVGAIFYFFKVAGLKHKVFPDPQWLFDVMSTFVTILDEEDFDGCYLYDLDQLKAEGRMSRHLAEHLLERRQKLGVREKHYNTLFCLLQLVDIFCPDISPQSSERLTVDDADYFYVPCMLDISSIYEEQSEWELSGVAEAVSGSSNSALQIPSLVFKPDNVSYFPEPLFFRLSSRTAYEFPEHPELKRNRIQVFFHGYCLKLELLYHSTRQYVIATVCPEDKEEPPSPGDVNLQCAHVRRFLYRQLDDAKQNGMSGFQYKVYFQHGKKPGINDVDEESLYPLPNCDEMPKAIINCRTKKPLRKKDVLSSCIKYWYSSEPSECGDIVGDIVLAQVAKSVQHAWMKLAQAMKPWPFYRNELVNFDDDTDNSNLGKAHRMLQKWRDEHKNQATISNLKRSLVEAKLEHILPIVDHGSSLLTEIPYCMASSNDAILAHLAASCDFASVERAVLRAGANQWSLIGKELGMLDAEIGATAHDKPTDVGKLQAIINIKKSECGTEEVKLMLLKACGNLVQPILGVVKELLGKGRGVTVPAPAPVDPAPKDAKIDVLIVTATKTEFKGVKAVLQEVSGQDTLEPCPIDYSEGVLPCKVATWEPRKGRSPLTVGVTRQADIGTDGATNLVVALKDALGKAIAKNGLVAMVGICAGDGSMVALGDVLIPWKIAVERGKLSKSEFKVQAGPVGLPHQLKTAVMTAEEDDDEAKWLNYLPAKFRNVPSPMYLFDATLQELDQWKSNDGVANIGDLYTHLMETYNKWPRDFINIAVIIEVLKTLQTSKYVIDVDGGVEDFQISSEGKDRIRYLTVRNESFPRADSKPIIHHDPVIMGGIVNTALEKKAWDEMRAHAGQSKAVGCEMEGHTFLGQMVTWCQTTRSIFIKAVADLGTDEYKMKEKYYQVYATAVAAAFLFHFLKVVDPSKWQTSTT